MVRSAPTPRPRHSPGPGAAAATILPQNSRHRGNGRGRLLRSSSGPSPRRRHVGVDRIDVLLPAQAQLADARQLYPTRHSSRASVVRGPSFAGTGTATEAATAAATGVATGGGTATGALTTGSLATGSWLWKRQVPMASSRRRRSWRLPRPASAHRVWVLELAMDQTSETGCLLRVLLANPVSDRIAWGPSPPGSPASSPGWKTVREQEQLGSGSVSEQAA